MKKLLVSLLLIGAATGAIFAVNPTSEKADGAGAAVAEAKTNSLPKVEYHMSRYKDFKTIEELKEEAPFVVVADYVAPKRTYTLSGLLFTESTFRVSHVFKGEQTLKDTDIIITETGGISEGKQFVMAGDELFDAGRYLLFLNKFDDHQNAPYDVYVVKGVFSGKFKLTNDKVRGYGHDPVRGKAEKFKAKELLKAVE